MITSIFVIESLIGERQTGLELFEDTLTRYNDLYWKEGEKINIKYFNIDDKAIFNNTLNEILNTTQLGDEIIIHFEMHGLKDLTGIILKNDEIIEWIELQNVLTTLNQKLNNNLHISMATCYGRYIYKILDYRFTAPFKSCISASSIITPTEIVEDYSPFYKCLIQYKDIYLAYNCLYLDNPETNFNIKDTEALIESIIDNLFLQYFHNHYDIFRSHFLLLFDIDLPPKEHESFKRTFSKGIGEYQKRYFMKI